MNIIHVRIICGIILSLSIALYFYIYIYKSDTQSQNISVYDYPEVYGINLNLGYHKDLKTNKWTPHKSDYWESALKILGDVTGGADMATTSQLQKSAHRGAENEYSGWLYSDEDQKNNFFICARPHTKLLEEAYWDTNDLIPEPHGTRVPLYKLTNDKNVRVKSGGCGIFVFGKKPKNDQIKQLQKLGIDIFPFSSDKWSIYD